MTLTNNQKERLLKTIHQVLPSAEWAPRESFIEDSLSDDEGRKDQEPVHLLETDSGVDLVVFIKANLSGQHYNTVSRVEGKVRQWLIGELLQSGTLGEYNSHFDVSVDLRLFRTDRKEDRVPDEITLTELRVLI